MTTLTLPKGFPSVAFDHPGTVVFGPFREFYLPTTAVRVHLPNGYELSITHGGPDRDPSLVIARARAPRDVPVPRIGTDAAPGELADATGEQVAAALTVMAGLPPAPGAIPALTRHEVTSAPRVPDCEWCQQENYPVPHWPRPNVCNSSYQRAMDGTERLFRIHCTCDWCF